MRTEQLNIDLITYIEGPNGRNALGSLRHACLSPPPMPQYFRSGDAELKRSPLAKKLMKISGVVGVFLGKDFITITKTPDIIWQVQISWHIKKWKNTFPLIRVLYVRFKIACSLFGVAQLLNSPLL